MQENKFLHWIEDQSKSEQVEENMWNLKKIPARIQIGGK